MTPLRRRSISGRRAAMALLMPVRLTWTCRSKTSVSQCWGFMGCQ
jgi:hypothetical protein